ncbi:hypothetical protein SAMN05421543_10917 [Alicyclobacillus macrosporangiidus]|uniref:Uncharacterized protein n=2 Tax=Alicyclobacillus macrosporangiidus TaxID=392015 RepID=A0A1I7J9B9_9BACL|nr:hypothetical protein SAMN05421543_10917 [Alicyclobacillus macrosporangiidus]
MWDVRTTILTDVFSMLFSMTSSIVLSKREVKRMEYSSVTRTQFEHFVKPSYDIVSLLISPYSVSGLIIWDEKMYALKREEVLTKLKQLVDANQDVVGSLTYEQIRLLDLSTSDGDKEFRRLCATLVKSYLDYRTVFDEMDRRMRGISRLRYAMERIHLPKGHGLSATVFFKRSVLLIAEALEPIMRRLVLAMMGVVGALMVWVLVQSAAH